MVIWSEFRMGGKESTATAKTSPNLIYSMVKVAQFLGKVE